MYTIGPDDLIPIPVVLRPDVVVKLHLPPSLIRREAEKIARIIRAFAVASSAEEVQAE